MVLPLQGSPPSSAAYVLRAPHCPWRFNSVSSGVSLGLNRMSAKPLAFQHRKNKEVSR